MEPPQAYRPSLTTYAECTSPEVGSPACATPPCIYRTFISSSNVSGRAFKSFFRGLRDKKTKTSCVASLKPTAFICLDLKQLSDAAEIFKPSKIASFSASVTPKFTGNSWPIRWFSCAQALKANAAFLADMIVLRRNLEMLILPDFPHFSWGNQHYSNSVVLRLMTAEVKFHFLSACVRLLPYSSRTLESYAVYVRYGRGPVCKQCFRTACLGRTGPHSRSNQRHFDMNLRL